MTKSMWVGAAAFAAWSAVCGAQAQAPKAVEHNVVIELAEAEFATLAGLAGLPELTRSFVSTEVGGRVIKGAPYAATAVSENTQTLADGNRIVRKSETKLARDGEGRTRQERADGSIYISDPVAGKTWVLRPKTKSAVELPRALRLSEGIAPLPPLAPLPPIPPRPLGAAPVAPGASPPAPPAPPPPAAGATSEEMRSWAESMRTWAREFAARFRTAEVHIHKDAVTDGAREESRTIVVRAPRIEARLEAGPDGKTTGEGTTTRDVTTTREVHVVSSGDGAAPMAWSGTDNSFAFAFGPGTPFPIMAPMGEGVSTSLGSRDFDGVRADGSRTTWTIPAGKIGNEKPIEIFSERWHAPDLTLVVQTRYVDPRSGERTYRLSQIKRGEPDAAHFKVPADYQVRSRSEERKREREMREREKK